MLAVAHLLLRARAPRATAPRGRASPSRSRGAPSRRGRRAPRRAGGSAAMRARLAARDHEEVERVRRARARLRRDAPRRPRRAGPRSRARPRLGRDHREERRALRRTSSTCGKCAAHQLRELGAVELLHVELVVEVALVGVLELVGAREHEHAVGRQHARELGEEGLLLASMCSMVSNVTATSTLASGSGMRGARRAQERARWASAA